MTLVNITLTIDEAYAVSDAMEAHIDGMTTAYGKGLREKLSSALSADATIDAAIEDHKFATAVEDAMENADD